MLEEHGCDHGIRQQFFAKSSINYIFSSVPCGTWPHGVGALERWGAGSVRISWLLISKPIRRDLCGHLKSDSVCQRCNCSFVPVFQQKYTAMQFSHANSSLTVIRQSRC